MPELLERELIFPPECDIPLKKLELTCRAQELLRYLHNVFAKWTATGLTQKEYDLGVMANAEIGINEDTIIPDKLKALYPYKAKLTEVEMLAYIKNEHKPRQNVISEQLGTQRAQFENEIQATTTWDSDIKVEDI